MEEFFRVRAELSKRALLHNVDVIKKKVEGKADWLAVVKSNAYGHGVSNLVPILEEAGAPGYAVATVEEGVEIRRLLKKDALILVLGYTHPSQYETALENDIDLTIYTLDQAKALSEAAMRLHKNASVHIKLETGMGRIGFPLNEQGKADIVAVNALPGIRLGGVFTHLPGRMKKINPSRNCSSPVSLILLKFLPRRASHFPSAMRPTALRSWNTRRALRQSCRAARSGWPEQASCCMGCILPMKWIKARRI